MYLLSTGNTFNFEDIDEESIDIVKNSMFHNLMDNNLEDLTFLRIPASLHTLVRWNKERKYKRDDYYDFRHAQNALPYYDYLFTENSLKDLTTHPKFKLSEKYNCTVFV